MAASETLTHLRESAAQHPNDGIAASRYAKELQKQGHAAQAAAEYRRALALDETLVDSWYGLGRLHLDSGATGEAARCFRRALRLNADRATTHFFLGKALFELGEIDVAIDHFNVAARASNPELRQTTLGALACIVPGSPRSDNAAVLQTRRTWAQIEAERETPISSLPKASAASGKLRLGYSSKFFHAANWMKPVWGVINRHDRSAFEIHLFSDGHPPSAESGYEMNSLDHVHNVRDVSNEEVAGIVARAGIDILVDLNGYSFQPRLGLFMRRPARIHIGWFNLYATSGIDAFDYIIGDAAVIPPEEEQFYCERVLRVPGSYLAYAVPYPVPQVTQPPCLTAGHITFGSFCSQWKFTDEVIAAWSKILREAPEARLLLKNVALGDASNQTSMRERFARCEVAPERIQFDGPAAHAEFLAAYERVDIALDTFPYNGATTTMEALWQGVPVLTFNGDRWASRQSRSLLLAAGLGEWCAADLDAYINRATSLARSPTTATELTCLRATMRERLAQTPVRDSAKLCRALEGLYLDVAQRNA